MEQLLADAVDGHLRVSVDAEIKRRHELAERSKGRAATGRVVEQRIAARRAPKGEEKR
jgi:hypothetical protein